MSAGKISHFFEGFRLVRFFFLAFTDFGFFFYTSNSNKVFSADRHSKGDIKIEKFQFLYTLEFSYT